ncbi:hypothetical protein L1049_004653 [Liquidambar formosana]|uniref:Protein FAR1-RELATED SEQUENCE n=1 Tax=Liquidambar formosana TaxID=63359 RepID=A0AAP0RPD0_LIQFO
MDGYDLDFVDDVQAFEAIGSGMEMGQEGGEPQIGIYFCSEYEHEGYDWVSFGEKDARNFIAKARDTKLGGGDAEAVCQYFKRMQSRNPNFFLVIDIDSEGRMRNLFWADARSRAAYESFSDVVSFDTTSLSSQKPETKPPRSGLKMLVRVHVVVRTRSDCHRSMEFQTEIRGMLYYNISPAVSDGYVLMYKIVDVLNDKDGLARKKFTPDYIIDRWRKDIKRNHYFVTNCYNDLETHEEHVCQDSLSLLCSQISKIAIKSSSMYDFTKQNLEALHEKFLNQEGNNDDVIRVEEDDDDGSNRFRIRSPLKVCSKGHPPFKRLEPRINRGNARLGSPVSADYFLAQGKLSLLPYASIDVHPHLNPWMVIFGVHPAPQASFLLRWQVYPYLTLWRATLIAQSNPQSSLDYHNHAHPLLFPLSLCHLDGKPHL